MRKAVSVPDRRIMLFTLALLGLGMVMVFGASSYEASLVKGSQFGLLSKHVFRVILALLVGVVATLVPYRISCRVAFWMIPLSLALLLLTLLGGNFVMESYGIGRWLKIFGVMIQPVELAKLSLALGLPYYIERNPHCLDSWKGGMDRVLALPALAILMLMLQPNFGSALALGLMVFLILFLAGAPQRFLLPILTCGSLLCWLGYLHVSKITERVDAWLGIFLTERMLNTEYAFQSYHALIGMGSGGWFGVGPGESTMKFRFLPESHTDFIYAILGEELGWIGAVGLLVLMAFWLARAVKIAHRSSSALAYLSGLAVAVMIFSYMAINLAVVVGLMPVAGLPLPFISYGGSALLTNMAAVGVLLNISRHIRSGRRPSDRLKGVR